MTFNDDVPTAEEAGRAQAQATPRRSRDPLAGPEAEALLRRAADVIASAKLLPLSSSVMINRDDVLDLLGQAVDRLPEDLSQARHLLKDREDFLARVRDEGDEILDLARAKAESMVQRTEVVKAAELKAKHIVKEAEDEARQLRHECEDFCDQRLAQFEIVLNRTVKMVQAGRAKLNGTPVTAPQGLPIDEGGEPETFEGNLPAAPRDQPTAGPVADTQATLADDVFFDQDDG